MNIYRRSQELSQYEMYSCFIASGRDRDGKVLLCYYGSGVF